jgi:uncharacterized protein YbaR (Trm112 family)
VRTNRDPFINSVRRLWFATRRLRLPIPKAALVLEIGSGDNPCPRSDVLFDMTLESHERAGGRTVHDRPLVLGLAERLPFRTGAFDYVIGMHVLEHSPEPSRFLGELQRVARAGYLETPDFWVERVFPMTMHRLEVGLEQGPHGNQLVIAYKPAAVPDDELARQFLRTSLDRTIIGRAHPLSLVTRYFWREAIHYRIVNPGSVVGWEPPPEVTRTDDRDSRSGFRRVAKRIVLNARRRRPIDLVPLLQCPDCEHNPLKGHLENGGLQCPGCGRLFAVSDGVPSMHPQFWNPPGRKPAGSQR